MITRLIELDRRRCRRLSAEHEVGRVVATIAGQPPVVPLNYDATPMGT